MLYSLAVVFLLIHLLQSGALGFEVDSKGDSRGHKAITKEAILETTQQVCRDLDLAAAPTRPLTVESVALACSSSGSKSFHSAIKVINGRHQWVDIVHMLQAEYHFDDEEFVEGSGLIKVGLSVVKDSIKEGNFEAARDRLGDIMHTLQDFYSHSNWIELENTSPHSGLLRQDIGRFADMGTPTCRNCNGENCQNNILDNILRDKILTTGYFRLNKDIVNLVSAFSPAIGLVLYLAAGPFTKPDGKCSHGGFYDETSRQEPVGGINKDKLTASHGDLHVAAANMAVAATSQLMEDVRETVGDTDFLRLMGISRRSKALCFAIDTTGSMRDDIAEVRRVTSDIIDSKRGTADEPSLYILVPFNDPGFGPLTRTTDPDVFKALINALRPTGGGDFPELSLSGLRLALTGAPPESEIFLFTDATAKDSHLKSTVNALIERTKSVVTCMLTGVLASSRRRRRDSSEPGQQTSRMSELDVQLYRDLSLASGGQTIQVTKAQLPQATSIIIESSSSSLVTILQAIGSPGNDTIKADNFSFVVDESVRNLTVYITGRSLNFTLTNPSGVSQSSLEANAVLGSIQAVGNFHTARLNSEAGLWGIRVNSEQPYTLKVIGQSSIDFLFDFVEIYQGRREGFLVLENRPKAGSNGTLVVSVTGVDSVGSVEVALVDAVGTGEVRGTVEPLGDGDFMARVDRIPDGQFVVRLRGVANSRSRASPISFQRQSSTRLRASSITVTARVDSTLEPGTTFSVPFTVLTSGAGGNFTIRVTNDRGFESSSPASLVLETGGSANGTLTLTVPTDTPSGSDVTLTIEADSPGATDTNYAILRLSIVTKVDVSPPVCQIVSVTANCSADCSLSEWELSAHLTDGSGTGIQSITLRQGNGTLVTSTVLGTAGENVTQAAYSASCCSPDVELVAVDGVGNVGTCFRSVRPNVVTTIQPPFSDVTTSTTDVTSATCSVPVTHTTPTSLCLTVGVFVMLLLG